MGFFSSLKKAASNVSKQLRHKKFELRAKELAEKWDRIKFYRPEIGIEIGNETYWYPINRVWIDKVEVGLFRKSYLDKVFVEYSEPVVYDEEEEEDEGWFSYEDDTTKNKSFGLNDKVQIRFTMADYEKLVSKEGEIL
ncbi:hypothetical protein [Thermococcus sp. ES12]|uniref:hypothetical protein n=1 Tax=Thermococcus sp. ES12 TaxID=1638246 RepID=UPI0014313165|nr:hypothetical protein [Thermococcus sp. ES12]NJE75896.1 hypothetical protein [Thermococcus sp. ES12]